MSVGNKRKNSTIISFDNFYVVTLLETTGNQYQLHPGISLSGSYLLVREIARIPLAHAK